MSKNWNTYCHTYIVDKEKGRRLSKPCYESDCPQDFNTCLVYISTAKEVAKSKNSKDKKIGKKIWRI